MMAIADVAVGQELPALRKGPVGRQRLVEWCAAENDYFPLHYDERVAAQMKLPGPPIQGTYRYALMGQMVQAWMGPQGWLARITARYRGLALENEELVARGRVTAVEPADGGRRITLEVWVENGAGTRVAEGEALVQARA